MILIGTIIALIVLIPFQDQNVYQIKEDKFDTKQPIASITGITAYTPGDPISILSDSDFGLSGYDFSGSGISSDPYLIENYSITGSILPLIHIQDTTAYFRIKNCSLNVIGSNLDAITLDNVIHGVIDNNTISNGSLDLYSSHNNTFSNNIINNTENGIEMSWSENNTFSGNNISYCSTHGVRLYYSSNNNIFSGNTIFNCTSDAIGLVDSCSNNIFSGNTILNCNDGIEVQSSSNNTFSGNTISNCSWNGIDMISSSTNIFSDNIIANCSFSGISMSSSSSNAFSGNRISYCDSSGYILTSSSNNIFSDNTLFNITSFAALLSLSNVNVFSGNTIFDSQWGISLSSSMNNTIVGNNIFNTTGFSISLMSSSCNVISGNIVSYCLSSSGISLNLASDNNTITGNTIFNGSSAAITLSNCSYNNISHNIIYNHTWYGIWIIDSVGSSHDNIVHWNNFYNNSLTLEVSQVSDEGVNNNISYNYWHDLGGASTYSIDGGSSNSDPNPLITPMPPMVIIITPSEHIYGTDTITVMLAGNAISYKYYIETVDFANQTWTQSDERMLSTDGTYTLHAYGNDTLNNITHVSFTFTIDTIAPTVDIDSPSSGMYTQNNVMLDYTVSDGIVTIYIDGEANSSSLPSGLTPLDLQDGSHTITVVAVDQAGNVNRSTIIFSLDTAPPTITLESPINDTDQHSGSTIDVAVIDVHLDTVLYNWNGTTNITWTGNYQTSLPTDETQHRLYVYANDSLGNWSSQMFVFTTDDTSPNIDIISPTDPTYSQDSVTLTYTVSDGVVTIYINGVANSTSLSSGSVISDLSDGSYNISIVAVDEAGNIGQNTVIFIIDTTQTSTDDSSTDTTTSQSGSFPELLTILLISVILVLVNRRRKKK